MTRSRIVSLLLAPIVAGSAAAPQARAQPAPEAPAFVETLPRDIAGVPGTWDLSRDGGTRRCVMTLTAESTPSGRRLSFPAGCRRALPILGEAAAWLFSDGAIRIVDKDVRPILAFVQRADARSLAAATPSGESYSLVPLQIAAMAPAGLAPAPAEPPRAGAEPAPPPGDRPAPGLYALDRYREQDVCRIELTAGAAPAVRLVEGCRDGGLAVFDPVAWSAAPGRLTLTARRGHVVNLVPAGAGRWRRDPEVGTTFVLRRVEPAPP